MGMYAVQDEQLKGLPESPPSVTAVFNLSVKGFNLQMAVPLTYRTTDPVAGEVVQPFQILPEATVNFLQPVHLFTSSKPKTVSVNVQTHKANFKGTLELAVPRGWSINPIRQKVELKRKGASQVLSLPFRLP